MQDKNTKLYFTGQDIYVGFLHMSSIFRIICRKTENIINLRAYWCVLVVVT